METGAGAKAQKKESRSWRKARSYPGYRATAASTAGQAPAAASSPASASISSSDFAVPANHAPTISSRCTTGRLWALLRPGCSRRRGAAQTYFANLIGLAGEWEANGPTNRLLCFPHFENFPVFSFLYSFYSLLCRISLFLLISRSSPETIGDMCSLTHPC